MLTDLQADKIVEGFQRGEYDAYDLQCLVNDPRSWLEDKEMTDDPDR